jgi:hypothetical protein
MGWRSPSRSTTSRLPAITYSGSWRDSTWSSLCGLQQWAAAARTTGTDLPVDELVRYIRGPAEALDYLRSRDIAHGAVNSGHTFLCAGRAILGSLGHARSLAGSGDSALNDLATTYAELRLGRPLNENQRGGADASSSVLGMPEWRQLGPKEQEAIRRGLAGRFDSCWEFARALQLAVA